MNKNYIYFLISGVAIITALLLRYVLDMNSQTVGLILLPLMLTFSYRKCSSLKLKYFRPISAALIAYLFWGGWTMSGALYALTGGVLAIISIFLIESYATANDK